MAVRTPAPSAFTSLKNTSVCFRGSSQCWHLNGPYNRENWEFQVWAPLCAFFPLPQPHTTKNKHSNWQYRTHQSQALVNLRQSEKTKMGGDPCFANNALIRCVNKNPLTAMALGPEKQIVKTSHTRSSTQGFPGTSLSTHHTHTHTRKPPFLSHRTLWYSANFTQKPLSFPLCSNITTDKPCKLSHSQQQTACEFCWSFN